MFSKKFLALLPLLIVPLACLPERVFVNPDADGGKGGTDNQNSSTGGDKQTNVGGDRGCGMRDCTSPHDNDCNGRVDRAESECSTCPLGVTQDCEGEGLGICRDGRRTCLLSKDNATVRWSECAPLLEATERDCTSPLDNDCNGTLDNEEETCRNCIADSTTRCDTDLPGICSKGTAICELDSETNTTAWGNCEQDVMAASRDCASAQDNDCSGTIDSEEAECRVCSANESRLCETHEQDGVGTCRAGTQTCVTSDPSQRSFSACAGSVGPTTETCGPTQQDSDCDGTVGNGSGCTHAVQIWSVNTSCSGDTVASTTSPGASYASLSTLQLFTASHPGTTPVHNCTASWTYYQTYYEKYVRIGGCQSGDRNDGIVGYLSTSPAAGYSALLAAEMKRGRMGGPYTVTNVPFVTCPSGCSCSAASVYQP